MDEDIRAVPHAIGGREELTGGEVLAYLGNQGYAAESEALMAAARKFPGAYMYTADRHRYAAYIMPRGYWRAGDCEKSEERIKAAPRRRW